MLDSKIIYTKILFFAFFMYFQGCSSNKTTITDTTNSTDTTKSVGVTPGVVNIELVLPKLQINPSTRLITAEITNESDIRSAHDFRLWFSEDSTLSPSFLDAIEFYRNPISPNRIATSPKLMPETEYTLSIIHETKGVVKKIQVLTTKPAVPEIASISFAVSHISLEITGEDKNEVEIELSNDSLFSSPFPPGNKWVSENSSPGENELRIQAYPGRTLYVRAKGHSGNSNVKKISQSAIEQFGITSAFDSIVAIIYPGVGDKKALTIRFTSTANQDEARVYVDDFSPDNEGNLVLPGGSDGWSYSYKNAGGSAVVGKSATSTIELFYKDDAIDGFSLYFGVSQLAFKNVRFYGTVSESMVPITKDNWLNFQ